MSAFDWPALMRVGLRNLRLTPDQFWSLTPAEFAFLLGHETGDGPLTRDRLEALAQAWPDEGRDKGDD